MKIICQILISSIEKGRNLTIAPFLNRTFDNDYEMTYFNSNGTMPLTSAAEAAIIASNLPGSATQVC